jgi:putative ABC transport system permease protein
MRAAWQLAISNLLRRKLRSGLLVASVMLCAMLICAVACAMASLTKGLDERIKATVGGADVKLKHVGGASFDAGLLAKVEAWPEVTLAVPRAQETIPLHNPAKGLRETVIGVGVIAEREARVRELVLETDTGKSGGKPLGRFPVAMGEVLLDTVTARKLQAAVGDRIEAELFIGPLPLTVVGIVRQPPLGAIFERMESFTTVEQLSALADKPGRISEIDVILREGADPSSFTARHKTELEKGLTLQATAKITSGLDKNLQSQQIGFVLASVLAFVASAFIITTGLTTAVAERARELAVIRCLGGFRWQLAASQLYVGGIIGGTGGLIGTPLGLIASFILINLFPEQLPGGFAFSWLGVILAIVGSVLSGLLGALFPAVMATRVSPLEGLSVRSRKARPWQVLAVLGAAVVCLGTAGSIIGLVKNGDLLFWLYIFLGVPCLLAGWFLLAVPTLAIINAVVSPLLGRLLGLPSGLLQRSISLTPFRHGFTAGAMMLGLAMMVSIWTNGGSILKDWLLALQIPDGFVQGLNMNENTRRRVAEVPGVASTCAITLQAVETDAFGVKGLSTYKTSFVAFEPTTFFGMTKVSWVEPADEAAQAEAIEKLKKGSAVIVAREFQVARGLGVGNNITLRHEGKSHTFEIVGVVTSPGLDIVSKFYDVGEGYVDQALSSVFGSRDDLIARFGNEAINLIQIALKPGVDGNAVMNEIKQIRGGGVLSAGSAVEIKTRITEFISGALLVASVVAVGAMVVACFAVANLIVAAVQTRRYEFGVLRAIGAFRGLLARLILGEALIIGLCACLLGCGMGMQAAWGGQRMYEVVIGLVLALRPPLEAMAVGCGAVLLITLGAAMPSALSLLKRQPRELLGAMKG